MSEKDQLFMQRAIQLALLGKATVSPNPMVGCVIVVEDKIIGEGWHQKAGEGHAEVNAIHSVKDKSLLKRATVYVTLEPCAHYGRTPPCAELLVTHQVKRVVIGCTDPHPLVAGKGIDILQKAGVELSLDCMKDECVALNNIFFYAIKEKIPYVVLKWAQTADGFIARENYDSKWISNAMSRQLVHKWRAELDAILVGKNTVLHDDPSLNVRDWFGKDPLRVVIDHRCELPLKLKVFEQNAPTIIYNELKDEHDGSNEWVKLDADNFVMSMLSDLYSRNINSLLVEGGSKTLQEFIDLGVWNEARLFHAKTTFEEGILAPTLTNHQLIDIANLAGNELINYKNTKVNV